MKEKIKVEHGVYLEVNDTYHVLDEIFYKVCKLIYRDDPIEGDFVFQDYKESIYHELKERMEKDGEEMKLDEIPE